MLDMLSQGAGELIQPFFFFGVAFWDMMLGLIGLTAVQTPMSFSGSAWGYIENDLAPWTTAIGATILNLSFYIGIIRQSNNLKQNFTMEIFVECCIKVVLGNTAMLWGMKGMKLLFGIAGDLSAVLLLDTPVVMVQEDKDLGSTLFYTFFGMIFFLVCVVCSITIFLTVYGRFLQLYMLAGTGPVAWGTIPGGPGMSQTAAAWFRTVIAKTFEIVLIVVAVVLAAKLCNAIDFGEIAGVAGVFDGAVQALQNIATMILLTASVKGMDVFMKRTFAL